MRLVLLGAGGAHKTETSIARAARTLGHTCRHLDVVAMSRRLGALAPTLARRRVDAFQPDAVILTRHAILLGDEAVRAIVRGRQSAFWYFDAVPSEGVFRLAEAVGTIFTTYYHQTALYAARGVTAHFLPQGMDPATDRPARWTLPWYRCDASFVGSGQYPYRYPVLRAVAAVSRLQIRGPYWNDAPNDLPVAGGAIRGRGLARVIRGAALSLGANAVPEQDREYASASNRMWKILGSGGLFLGPYVDGIEHFARGGEHALWYRTPDEAAALTREYLGRPEERRRIAEAGRRHALGEHTYAHRLKLLLAGTPYPLL